MNPEADVARISRQKALMEEEAACLERVARAGDREAFSRLYDLQAPLLYGLACRMLGREDEAREALQEVFLKAWEDARRYDRDRGSARAWLVSMTRSRCLDRLRRRSRVLRRSADESEAAEKPAEDEVVAIEALVRAEAREAVLRALDALPSPQRKALEAAFFDGMTQAEIAEESGEPLGTVKTRMRLGMRKLAETLKAYL